MRSILALAAVVFVAASTPAIARNSSPVLDHDKDPDRVICKRVNRKGSFIKTRVCAKQAAWMEERRRSLHTIDRFRELESHRPLPPHLWSMGQ